MKWLNSIVDGLMANNASDEIVVSSGVSPSGKYHLGTLREVLTAEAISREIIRRGGKGRHIHVVDDLDVFRKVPHGLPQDYEKFFGMPLCDIPGPDSSNTSYADYYLDDLLEAAKDLRLDMDIVRAHEKYRTGFFTSAIEKSLNNVDAIKNVLEKVSGHKLGQQWSPVQINEDGYLKNRVFVEIDTKNKEILYLDKNGERQKANYSLGQVKLNWRIDWPARWWLLNVAVEPFGRDHATKGGSYDTGKVISSKVFSSDAPVPVPYNFINRTGQTKKMSKSSGDTITASELLEVLPAEIVWFFILRYPPDKLLFFDAGQALMKLVDDFSELLAKSDKTSDEKQMIELCTMDIGPRTVSNIPFNHLVVSYQASLRDSSTTLDVLKRTEHRETAISQAEVIRRELVFIENWLNNHAPDDIKFSLKENINQEDFTDAQLEFFKYLANRVDTAPEDKDGEWFHKAIYDYKATANMQPKELFQSLYRLILGKDSGPRAGWFLSILPRDWLVKRLNLEG